MIGSGGDGGGGGGDGGGDGAGGGGGGGDGCGVVTYRLPYDITTPAGKLYRFRFSAAGHLAKPPGTLWFQTMLGPVGEAEVGEAEVEMDAVRRERPLRRKARKHN